MNGNITTIMNNQVIATTTNSIDNARISKYIDLISTNVVVGTNVFSDLGASLTDFFGGFSDSYQRKLQNIYAMAIDNLKLKAAKIGANAIVGLKIDFDEISGKGKSMFMISAIGTAAIVKFDSNQTNENSSTDTSIIPNEKLEKEITRRNIISNLKMGYLPDQGDWIYLLNNPIQEISSHILKQYLKYQSYGISSSNSEEEYKLLQSNTANYFSILDRETAVEILYKKLKTDESFILEIIENNMLFAPSKILGLIKTDEVTLAVKCLSADISYYSNEDLVLMKEIIESLESLSEKGKIESRKGILGKAKDYYICPNGHSNDVTSEFCSDIDCHQNIRGLTSESLKQIEAFKLKVSSLSSLMHRENSNPV